MSFPGDYPGHFAILNPSHDRFDRIASRFIPIVRNQRFCVEYDALDQSSGVSL